VQGPLKGIFTPEFLDRLDEVIAFETFDEHGILHITNQMLDEIRKDLAQRDLQVSFSPEVAGFLVTKMPKGNSARPMRSVMREHIEDPLSLEILRQGSEEPSSSQSRTARWSSRVRTDCLGRFPAPLSRDHPALFYG
jgi:ATP-dependent Clp protease ATP-binding subunit ClpC